MIPDRSLIQQSQELYKGGLTIRKIAKRLNISRSSVGRFVKKASTPEVLFAHSCAGQRTRRTKEAAQESIRVSRISYKPAVPKKVVVYTDHTTTTELIKRFISENGVTLCPTVYLIPTYQSIRAPL